VTSLFTHTPVWSPDGSFILFSGTGLPPGEFGPYVIRPDGSDLRRAPASVIGGPFDADWTA
jgi:hypothetical protein